jgi:predicted HicB family RNase H-like nuclease
MIRMINKIKKDMHEYLKQYKKDTSKQLSEPEKNINKQMNEIRTRRQHMKRRSIKI